MALRYPYQKTKDGISKLPTQERTATQEFLQAGAAEITNPNQRGEQLGIERYSGWR